MAIDELNFDNYVFNTGVSINVPSIDVDLINVTVSSMQALSSSYKQSAEDYAKFYLDSVINRQYIYDMFQKDLAASTQFLTLNGINKESNTITLHNKSDDVFNLAKGSTTISTLENVNTIASNYYNINSNICLDDNGTSTALISSYKISEEYDTQAVKVTAGTLLTNAIFIRDNFTTTGNDRTFTNYDTVSQEGSKCVNTAQYNAYYADTYQISDENIVSSVWLIKDVNSSDAVKAYTTSGFVDGATWTTI